MAYYPSVNGDSIVLPPRQSKFHHHLRLDEPPKSPVKMSPMRRFFRRLSLSQKERTVVSPPLSPLVQYESFDDHVILPPATPADVLRFRYHHGVNLGACFVLEKWLFPSMFVPGADTSELAAVAAHAHQYDIRPTRHRWEAHWHDFLSEADLDFLESTARVNAVRLPIGYFTLGPRFCVGTPFAPYANVYANAWSAVRKMVSRLHHRGIGVLLDLHALPGGANTDDHSGTNFGVADFWRDEVNVRHGLRCIEFLAKEVRSMEGVIGIQICNEAEAGAHGLHNYYDTALSIIAAIDTSIPVYISDAWDLPRALDYALERNGLDSTTPAPRRSSSESPEPHEIRLPQTPQSPTSPRSIRPRSAHRITSTRGRYRAPVPPNPIIIDTHQYFTFSPEHRAQTPARLIASVPLALDEISSLCTSDSVSDRGGAVSAIVGEWSCVLDPHSWDLRDTRMGAPSKESLIAKFAHAQCKVHARDAAGSFFWTLKMDWMPGGEWGFVEQVARGNVRAPEYMTLGAEEVRARTKKADLRRDARRSGAVRMHAEYWSRPENRGEGGGWFEHWKFGKGWDVGWNDGHAFYGARGAGWMVKGGLSGGDRIGAVDLWIRKRLVETAYDPERAWEFEAGVRQGIRAFEEEVGMVD